MMVMDAVPNFHLLQYYGLCCPEPTLYLAPMIKPQGRRPLISFIWAVIILVLSKGRRKIIPPTPTRPPMPSNLHRSRYNFCFPLMYLQPHHAAGDSGAYCRYCGSISQMRLATCSRFFEF